MKTTFSFNHVPRSVTTLLFIKKTSWITIPSSISRLYCYIKNLFLNVIISLCTKLLYIYTKECEENSVEHCSSYSALYSNFFFASRDVRYASRVVHHCSRYSDLKKKSFGNTAFPQQRAGL